MIGAAACLTAIVAASPVSAAVSLKTGLVPDRQVQFDYTQSIEINQNSTRPEAEPVAEKHSLETKAQFTVKITKVSADGGGEGTVSIRTFSARQENPDGPVSVAFDFTQGAPAGGEGIGALEAAIAKAPIVFEVDATGKVMTVSGLDGIQEAMATAGQVPQTLRAFFDPIAMTKLLTLAFSAEGGIGEREIGSTWESSMRVPFGQAGALELNTTSALQLADAGLAVIAGVTKFDLFVPREPAEGVAKVELGGTDGQALTQWDLTTGGLISHTNTQNITTTWTMATLKVEQTQTSKTEMKRSGN